MATSREGTPPDREPQATHRRAWRASQEQPLRLWKSRTWDEIEVALGSDQERRLVRLLMGGHLRRS
jgi:hypothetical protein